MKKSLRKVIHIKESIQKLGNEYGFDLTEKKLSEEELKKAEFKILSDIAVNYGTTIDLLNEIFDAYLVTFEGLLYNTIEEERLRLTAMGDDSTYEVMFNDELPSCYFNVKEESDIQFSESSLYPFFSSSSFFSKRPPIQELQYDTTKKIKPVLTNPDHFISYNQSDSEISTEFKKSLEAINHSLIPPFFNPFGKTSKFPLEPSLRPDLLQQMFGYTKREDTFVAQLESSSEDLENLYEDAESSDEVTEKTEGFSRGCRKFL